MRSIPLQELMRPFAKSITAKAVAVRDLELTSQQMARIMESISDDIKKCTNFVDPGVSSAALRESQKVGIDIWSMSWHNQTRHDAGRRLFHLEHINPVSLIRDTCCQSCEENAILATLLSDLRAIWILKSEDQELTRLGYRSKRPDPVSAYHQAGIEIVSRDRPQAGESRGVTNGPDNPSNV